MGEVDPGGYNRSISNKYDLKRLTGYQAPASLPLGYGEDLYPALADFCEITGIKPILL